jgi:protein-L-isoaspartate(D-aspartate) O-methyltransferase
MKRLFLLMLLLVGAAATEPVQSGEYFATERRQMVKDITEMATNTASVTGIGKFASLVLEAMGEVPRHEFVPREKISTAYKNRPLEIGHRQTISQPFIVALMTELLNLKGTDRVLEVGTGSGYQAAVLSLLAAQVYSIEIIPELGEAAQNNLRRLGYANVQTKIGDGYLGWPAHAPFDGIIVTAAPDHIPQALIDQLKPNGRMVIPVGGFTQDLLVLTKRADGTTISETIVPVRFVPLTRD